MTSGPVDPVRTMRPNWKADGPNKSIWRIDQNLHLKTWRVPGDINWGVVVPVHASTEVLVWCGGSNNLEQLAQLMAEIAASHFARGLLAKVEPGGVVPRL